jgi:hypothetical protein
VERSSLILLVFLLLLYSLADGIRITIRIKSKRLRDWGRPVSTPLPSHRSGRRVADRGGRVARTTHSSNTLSRRPPVHFAEGMQEQVAVRNGLLDKLNQQKHF